MKKEDVAKLMLKQNLCIYFVGAFAGGKGKHPQQYENHGKFRIVENNRLKCRGMKFSRSMSKISFIRDTYGNILYGKQCKMCGNIGAVKYKRCAFCGGEYRHPDMLIIKNMEMAQNCNGLDYIKIELKGDNIRKWLFHEIKTGKLVKNTVSSSKMNPNMNTVTTKVLCENIDETFEYLKKHFSLEDYFKIEKEILEQSV